MCSPGPYKQFLPTLLAQSVENFSNGKTVLHLKETGMIIFRTIFIRVSFNELS
jgi:hypothetical protein